MNINIRKWQIEDLDDLVYYANNKNIADNLADEFPYPYTAESGQQFIQRVASDDPTKIFAITIDNKAIGSIGIFPESGTHRKNAAIAYWVAEPFWGRGIAAKAIKLIIEYGLRTFNITRIYAKPYSSSLRSHRVLEKTGFKLEAIIKDGIFKNGKYLDELIYAYTNK